MVFYICYLISFKIKEKKLNGCWWLTLIILATWEAEIGKIKVRGQPKKIVLKTPSPKVIITKWTGGVAQMVKW
jgi:hypothetical protein